MELPAWKSNPIVSTSRKRAETLSRPSNMTAITSEQDCRKALVSCGTAIYRPRRGRQQNAKCERHHMRREFPHGFETSSRGHSRSTRREPDPADPLTVQARYIGPVKTTPLRQAILDFAAGRADAARRVCLDLLEHAPEHAGAMHLLGLIAHHAGKHAEARNLLRRAAESPDATALYLLSYAELYCKNIDRRAAMAATRRAVALDESSVLGWFCMGNLLLEAREFEESRRCFEQAVLLDAAFWQGRANLALVRARLGEPDEGIAEFERLLREQPGNAELHGNYAALLQELGRYEEALGQAQSAMRDRPDTLEPYLRIADIELQRGRHHAALAGLADIEARWLHDPRLLTLKAHLLRHLDQS